MTTENLLINTIGEYPIQVGVKIPEWVRLIQESCDDEAPIAGDGMRYFLVNQQCYFENHQTIKFKRTIRQPINMQGVETCSKILIDFHPKNSSLIIHSIQIQRDDQFMDKLPSIEMQILKREYKAEQNILSGDITLSIILEDIRINDILTVDLSEIFIWEFHLRYSDLLFPLEYGVPVHRLYFFLTFDRLHPLQYKFLDKEEDIIWEEAGEKKTLIINKNHVAAKNPVKEAPYWYWPFSYLQVGFKKTWRDIAIKYAQYFTWPTISHPNLINLLDEIRAKSATDEDIVLHALAFINHNIRYFANHTATDFIKPTDPNITIKRAYGDCKDLTFLLHTILSFFNINSSPVLVHPVLGKNLINVLPSASLFNHVILVVRLDHQCYFIDPTIRQDIDSLNYLYHPSLGYGLICDKNTEELIDIDSHLKCKNHVSVIENYNIVSWEENEVIFKATVTLSGFLAVSVQKYFINHQDDKNSEFLKGFYHKYLQIKEVISHAVDGILLKNNQLTYSVQYRVALNSMLNNRGKNYAFELVPLHILEQLFINLADEAADYYYGQPFSIEYKINLLEKEVQIINQNDFTIIDDAFTLTRSVKYHDHAYITNYYFEKLKSVVSRQSQLLFLDNLKRAQKSITLIVNNVGGIRKLASKKSYFSKFPLPYSFIIGIMLMSISTWHAQVSNSKVNKPHRPTTIADLNFPETKEDPKCVSKTPGTGLYVFTPCKF